MKRSILLVFFLCVCCKSFQTSISFSYEPPPLFRTATANFLTGAVFPKILAHSARIIYNVQFKGALNAILSITDIDDSNKRTFVDFKISIQNLTSTGLSAKFQDNGLPKIQTFCNQFKVKVLIYDCSQMNNIQQKLWLNTNAQDIFIQQLVQFDILPWTGSVITAPFPVSIKCELNYSNVFHSYSGTTYIQGSSLVKVRHHFDFPIRAGTTRQIGLTIVVIIVAHPIQVTWARLNSNDNINFFPPTLSNNMYSFVGLRQFVLDKNRFNIQFTLDIPQQSIISPVPYQGPYTVYNFLLFQDLILNPPNPMPTIRLELVRLLSYSLFNSTIILIYQCSPLIQKMSLSQIEINISSKLSVKNVRQDQKSIFVICESTQNVHGLPIQVRLNWTEGYTKYEAVTNLTLSTNPSSKTSAVIRICQILQFVYLTIFALSLPCVKIVGIQMMASVQLTFYSQIPIGFINYVFLGLGRMNYVSGYNMKFHNLKEVPLPYDLQIMGLNSNFFSNANIMLALILVCPVMSGVMFLFSKVSRSYKYKPRSKMYGIAFLCQWLFTFILFNCYNIYVSLVIDIQNLGKQDVVALFLSVLVSLFPVVVCMFYYFFRQYFKEFVGQFNQNQTVGKLSLQSSKHLCSLYPSILALEMILVPLLLGIQEMSELCLYLALALNVFTTVYLGIVRPHLETLSNIRSLIHRGLTIILVLLLIISKNIVTPSMQENESAVDLVRGIVGVLILGLLLNTPYIVWKLFIWFKKSGIIDMKMYLQHIGQVKKARATLESNNPMLYPILQYGMGRQKLLDKQKARGESNMNISNVRTKDCDRMANNKRRQIDQKLQQERLQ